MREWGRRAAADLSLCVDSYAYAWAQKPCLGGAVLEGEEGEGMMGEREVRPLDYR